MTKNIDRLFAISFDGATFKDLQYFLFQESITVNRISPEELFSRQPTDAIYINLVSNDMQLRKKISLHLDHHKLKRFNYIHPSSVVCENLVDQGLFVYPNCSVYPNVKLGNDIILHANVAVGHYCTIGDGTYVSGSVTVGGGTKIGRHCYLGLGASFRDQIQIGDGVHVSMGAVVRHNLLEAGVYGNPALLKKLS
jgi:UDP-3-O-[3-hydroxymyristoyl] glucosamine N-acyltransferase